jgi:hypothetical protein
MAVDRSSDPFIDERGCFEGVLGFFSIDASRVTTDEDGGGWGQRK